jgi:hypothetical protein
VPWATVGDFHPKVVSEHLGHATVSTTLDTYSHAIPAMQEEAAVKIAGLVFAGASALREDRTGRDHNGGGLLVAAAR